MGDWFNVMLLSSIYGIRTGRRLAESVNGNDIEILYLCIFIIMMSINLYQGWLQIYNYKMLTVLALIFIFLCLEVSNDANFDNILNMVVFIYIILYEKIFTFIACLLY